MTQIVLGPNKAYPSIPSVSGDLENHTLVLQAIKEAIDIHERRTRNTDDSFVRLSELEALGLLNVDADTGIVEDDDDDGSFIKRDGTSSPTTGLIQFGSGISVAGNAGLTTATVSSTLNVSGAVTFQSSLDVDGLTTLDALTVDENAIFNSNLTVNQVGTEATTFNLSGTGAFTVDHSGGGDILFQKGGAGNLVFDHQGSGSIQFLSDIVAGTVNADFNALTATSYGGILEANLLDKTAAETITGAYTFSADLTTNDIFIVSTSPALFLQDTNATLDEGNWIVRGDADQFRIQTANDAAPESGAANVMQVTRAGTVISQINFGGPVDVNGALTATSYGGILEANLLDKTVNETITGQYTFGDTAFFTDAGGLGARLANNTQLLALNAAGTINVNLVYLSTVDTIELGASGYRIDANDDVRVIGAIAATSSLASTGLDEIVGFVDVNGGRTRFGSYNWFASAWQPLTLQGSDVIVAATDGEVKFTSGLSVEETDARLYIKDTDAALDEKDWLVQSTAGTLRFYSANDARSSFDEWMKVDRTGLTVDLVTLQQNLLVNGSVTASSNVVATGYVFADSYFQVTTGSGGSGMYMDSESSYVSTTLYAPALRWREADNTNIAAVRGYVAGGVNYLALGTGFINNELIVSPAGIDVIGDVDATGSGQFDGGVTLLNGISFGAVTAASENDLSEHIALFSTTYGFSITAGALNVVANGTAWAQFGSQGEFKIRARSYNLTPSALTGASDLDAIDDGWYYWTSNNPVNALGDYAVLFQIDDGAQPIQVHFGRGDDTYDFGIRRKDSGVWDAWTTFPTKEHAETITGQYTFSAAALFTGGSAAAPGLAFSAESNTGFYRPAAGQVALSLLGVPEVTFTASQTTFNNTVYANYLSTGTQGGTGGVEFEANTSANLSLKAGTTTGGWARGIRAVKKSDASVFGGFGWLGTNETLTSFNVGFASTWWGGSATLELTTSQFRVGNYAFDINQTVGAGQDNYVLTYDNASGQILLEAAAAGGGGDVSASGSPLNDQLAIWVDGTTIEGNANLTFASNILTTPVLDATTRVEALEVRTGNAQQLVLNAGESSSYFTGQTNELVYINAESGLQINSSPDNWTGGWAGRNTATINDASGNSSLPGDLSVAGEITSTGDAPVGLGAGKSALSADFLHIDGKEVIDANDTWIRLNQNNDFSSGVYTPYNIRADGALYSQVGNIYTASTTLNYQAAAYLRSVKYNQTGVDAWTVYHSAAVTAGSWYTILTDPAALDITTTPVGKTGASRAGARVRIWDLDSGQHSYCEFQVSCHYGRRPTVTLINRSGYGSALTGVRGIRVIRYSTYNGVAVQVMAGHTGTLHMQVQQLGTGGFTARDFIAETAEATWNVEELDFNNLPSDDVRFAVLTGASGSADDTFDGIAVGDGQFFPALDWAGTEGGWFQKLTGNYGSVNVAGCAGSTGAWAGYSIENEYVLMSYSGAGRIGIYNDVDNEWMQQWYRNGRIEMYYNGALRAQLENGRFEVLNGYTLRALDSTNADHIEMDHDGTYGVITTGSGDGEIQLKAGGVTRIETQWDGAAGHTTSLLIKNHAGSFYDAGLNVLPVFNDDTSDTLEEAHCGAINIKDNATARTLTLEASSSTNFPVYGVTHIVNNNASGNYSVNEGTGTTLYYIEPGVGLTDTLGGCTVGPGGVATVWRRSGSVYWIWGSEITP